MLPPIFGQRLRTWIYPYYLAKKDAFECITPSHMDTYLQGNTQDFHYYPFCVNGYYDFRNIAIALTIASEEDTIIEVGANIGTETIYLSDIVGSKGAVHAFEPLPANILRLKSIISLSENNNIILHPYALSNKVYNCQFVVPTIDSSGTGHIKSAVEISKKNIDIEVKSLDSIKNTIRPAKLILVDIEGEEVNFLMGAKNYILEYQPYLILEASPNHLQRRDSSIKMLYNTIKELGYSVYRIGRFGIYRVNNFDINYSENWFCINNKKPNLSNEVNKMIFASFVLPFIFKLNPISKNNRDGLK